MIGRLSYPLVDHRRNVRSCDGCAGNTVLKLTRTKAAGVEEEFRLWQYLLRPCESSNYYAQLHVFTEPPFFNGANEMKVISIHIWVGRAWRKSTSIDQDAGQSTSGCGATR